MRQRCGTYLRKTVEVDPLHCFTKRVRLVGTSEGCGPQSQQAKWQSHKNQISNSKSQMILLLHGLSTLAGREKIMSLASMRERSASSTKRTRSRSRSRDRDDGYERNHSIDSHKDHRGKNYNIMNDNNNNRVAGFNQSNSHSRNTHIVHKFPHPLDEKLDNDIKDDPRVREDGHKVVKIKGGGRNTESFDPASTLVRPSMRIIVGSNREVYGKPLKHDDVIICPEFLCKEDDWNMYYDLIKEMREATQNNDCKGSEFISWAEGAHLISKNPSGSQSYLQIQEKISKYFEIPQKSVGTRFNWYRDSTDWKPLHHDSAAFNPSRARNQNITVGCSLGSTRELVFMHARTGERLYFPQTNGMLFSFGRDVNIHYKHGINALQEDEQNGKGRVSIILWGNAPHIIDEKGSPHILNDNTRGGGHSIHASGRGNSGGNTNGGGVCRDYQKNACTRGSACRFTHQ